jgi:hypothetical protein
VDSTTIKPTSNVAQGSSYVKPKRASRFLRREGGMHRPFPAYQARY